MPGLSFIHLGMLAATAAVAIPILIHLLFRQRVRNISIGSIRFLQNVVREHRRKRRVRQWILLALRTLAVLLLVLLFARPYLHRRAQQGIDEEVVILVDRSASMRAQLDGGPTAIARALDEVRAETTRLGENATVHFAWFDSSGVEELALDKFFERQEAGWLGTDYGLAFGWARGILANGGRSSRRIVLCTDLQRRGQEASPIPPLGLETALDVRDVGMVVVRDLAVMQADAPQVEIRPGEPIRVRAVIRNGGALVVKALPVKLALQGPLGKVEASKTLDIPGGGATTVDLALEITTPGIYSGTVSLDTQDALAWNNQRYLAFEARPPDRVLLVDGQEGRSVFGNETYFLETALRLRSKNPAERVGAFEVERIVWEAGEGFPDLIGFRALILANLGRLSATDVARLTEYVRAGGSVIWFSGDQTSRAILDSLADAGLIAPAADAEPKSGAFRVTKWRPEHAALKIFDDPQRGDLRRLTFDKLLTLKATDQDQALLTADNQAVLLERQVGRGRFLYAAWAADREWSDWPRTRLFVPLVRQLTAYATGALAERQQVVQEIVARREQQPGVTRDGARIVVRNVDAEEAVLDRTTIDELAVAAGAHTENPAELEATQKAALAAAAGAQRPEEIWRFLIWTLFVILTAELLLASRIHN